MPGRTRPIEKFAEATAKCSPEVCAIASHNLKLQTNLVQGAVYGKCIAANYQNAHRDMCAKEFMLLKDCYLVRDSLSNRLISADSRLEGGWQEGIDAS